MTALPSTVRCAGCGTVAAPEEPYPFRCPRAGTDDVDHVMVRALDVAALGGFPAGDEANPFLRYRRLLRSYHLARANGWTDEQYVSLVAELDDAVAAVDGHGFAATPFQRSASLSARLGFGAAGGVWVKDETGNVAGSHKGRHLMGLLLHLEVTDRLGWSDHDAPLAIASCGNAALAAAVVARAGRRELRVFVPTDADASVVDRLRELRADIQVCPRLPGTAGDPTYLRLREELAAGAVPFTCQGNENGLAIEGGATLAYEMATELGSAEVGLDHLVVQVGGGALASACVQGLAEAEALHALGRMPRVHTVQTTGAHPLERAYYRVRHLLGPEAGATEVHRAVHTAAQHRSAYMWPWEDEPKSVAGGILDDETYDWQAVVAGMLVTGGRPLVVDEGRLVEANEVGTSTTGIHADETGTSGLGGAMSLRADGDVGPDERVAVLFTGVRRSEG